MSKYDPLWRYIQSSYSADFRLSFSEIESILGFPIDHSFLTCKKELCEYGFEVYGISMKGKTVTFVKL